MHSERAEVLRSIYYSAFRGWRYSTYGSLADVWDERKYRQDNQGHHQGHCKNPRGSIHTGIVSPRDAECTNCINYMQQTQLWPDCSRP